MTKVEIFIPHPLSTSQDLNNEKIPNEDLTEVLSNEALTKDKLSNEGSRSQTVSRGSTTDKQPEKPLICPVCMKANQCAVSMGRPIQDCWCLTQSAKASIAPRILKDLTGKACVCQSCYKKMSA